MTTLETGTRLVELLNQGKSEDVYEELYSPEVESIEPAGPDRVTKGFEGIAKKNEWWTREHEIKSVKIEGPWPHGDQFALTFEMDVTVKQTGVNFQMKEVALYTVKDGKIVEERFFYSME